MKKRKPRKCRICKKRPVWVGGDVKNPGPVCKKCYHKNVWPERMASRGKRMAAGADRLAFDDFGMPFDDDNLDLEDYGVPLDDQGMPLAWSSDQDYFRACILWKDLELPMPWGSELDWFQA